MTDYLTTNAHAGLLRSSHLKITGGTKMAPRVKWMAIGEPCVVYLRFCGFHDKGFTTKGSQKRGSQTNCSLDKVHSKGSRQKVNRHMTEIEAGLIKGISPV